MENCVSGRWCLFLTGHFFWIFFWIFFSFPLWWFSFFWHFLRFFWPGPIFCYFTGPFLPMFSSVDFLGFGVLHLPEFLVGFFGVFGGFEDSLVFLCFLRFFWIFLPNTVCWVINNPLLYEGRSECSRGTKKGPKKGRNVPPQPGAG